jgi:hypothetical protein
MANISATATIDSIIKDLQHISKRDFEGEGYGYNRLLTLVIRAIKDIRKFHAPSVVTQKQYNLSNLINGVLSYPDDCIGVVGVFYEEGGTLFPASERNDIVWEDVDEDGSVSSVTSVNDNYIGTDFYNNYYFTLTNYDRAGGRNRYYYTDDKENRRLIFDATADVKIFLKYVSTGIDATLATDSVVPEEYVETIEAYVLWQEALKRGSFDKRFLQSVRLYKNAYNEATRRLKAFQSPTIEQWKDMLYQTFKQGVKR